MLDLGHDRGNASHAGPQENEDDDEGLVGEDGSDTPDPLGHTLGLGDHRRARARGQGRVVPVDLVVEKVIVAILNFRG